MLVADFHDPDCCHVGGIESDQRGSLGPSDAAVPCRQDRDGADGHAEQGVAAHPGAERERGDDRADAERDQAYGGVGADDVTERDRRRVAHGGCDRRSQLFGLGAGQQQRKGEARHAQEGGGRREMLSEGLRAPHDDGDTGEQRDHIDHHTHRGHLSR